MINPRYEPGESVPWFVARSSSNPEYHFGSVAGRHIVLLFLGSMNSPLSSHIYREVLARSDLFDDKRVSLFPVSIDPADEARGSLRERIPGIRIFWDFEAKVSTQFGVATRPVSTTAQANFVACALLLDPTLRVIKWFTPSTAEPNFARNLLRTLEGLPWPIQGQASTQAPILMLERVFEPDFCRRLMGVYEERGGEDSGYMKSEGGQIRGVIDHNVKRRSDCLIQDESLKRVIGRRILDRLNPELHRVFRFRATRMERYLVACYDSAVGGYFRPHRDNDGDGHRQFAVTINLNAEEYEGGDLRFPEYGLQTYRAPTGGACVFSCGLMHEATPVTSGRRYAFLPFLYDEAAAARREAMNDKYIDPVHRYKYVKADGQSGE
jgi:predicted 2-oxoglutarate/Fe(II)-dependent dioxygenase YbiX